MSNSPNPCEPRDTTKLVQVSGNSLRLSLRGLGHPPSFKNRKRAILDSATGKLRTLTEPEAKAFMNRATESLKSQLLLCRQTIALETSLECAKRSLIALLPLDDSRQWIPEIVIRDAQVEPGHEGADILIERIE